MLKRIKKQVEKNPNRVFYKNNDSSITYKELWDKASTYGSLLKKEGTSPVIIYGDKDIDVVISIVSCLIAKRAYIPVGLCTPLNRLKQIIELTSSSLILTNEELNIKDINILTLDELNKYWDYPIKESNNNIAYIIFTSGSTGIPKGVPISYNNLNNFINWISNNEVLKIYKNINVLNQASFSFDLSVADFYYSICNGHTLIAFNSLDDSFNNLIESIKDINLIVCTPTFIKLLLLDTSFNSENIKDLKCIYFCGETLGKKEVSKLLSRFNDLKIINAYGPTEATSAVSSTLITKDTLNKFDILPVGDTSFFATNIEIINDEIVLSGPSLSSGYLNDIKGGFFKENNKLFYRTGDIGFIKDNKLFCKGRIDNQIKYKGYRIELNDIEENINLIDGVSNSVVIPKLNEEGLCKGITAYVISDNLTSNDIKNELIKRIPKYMIPNSIKLVETLPINCNFKIDRKALSSTNE